MDSIMAEIRLIRQQQESDFKGIMTALADIRDRSRRLMDVVESGFSEVDKRLRRLEQSQPPAA